jgi:hypothetical protein
MAYQKLQPGRSRTYFPSTFSDTVDNVALTNNIILGVTSPSGTPGVLTSSSATTFIQDKVQPGDLVLNATVSSRGQSTLVKQVISDTELILQDADAIFFPSNFFFITPPPSEPAVLNVQQTTAGGISLKITTSGGDDLTFVGLQSGSYLPVQTTRIWETVGDNIIENGSFRSGSNLIQNGSFNEIGPELVTNGDFSATGTDVIYNGGFDTSIALGTTGSGWVNPDAAAAYNLGGCKITRGVSGFARLRGADILGNDDIISLSKSYKITYTVVENNGAASVIFDLAGTFSNDIPLSLTTHTVYVTSGTSATQRFQVYNQTASSNITLTDIVVKELGADWTLQDEWSIGEDKATYDATANAKNIKQLLNFELGKSYKIKFTTSTGTAKLKFTDQSGTQLFTDIAIANYAPNSYELYGTAIASTELRIYAYNSGGAEAFSITNISVQEVAPYWTVTNNDSTHYVNFPTGYAQLIAATDSPQVQLEQNVLDATGLKSYEINCNIDYGQGSNLILNGDFSATGADLVLDGNFPLPNVNWIIAASTTINGGSATFGGLGAVTEAEMLLASFVVRVEADGGVVEAQTCLASDLTFLTENP